MIFDPSKVEIELKVFPEDIPVRGNAMVSGNDGFDAEIEDEIIDRLDSGNVWAWCTIEVTARYEGIPEIVGSDHLGCCSYADEKDFRCDGYFDDMRETATDRLRERLEAISHVVCDRRLQSECRNLVSAWDHPHRESIRMRCDAVERIRQILDEGQR